MNKDVIILAWLISFIAMVLFANSLDIKFWLSFTAFAFVSYSFKCLLHKID